MPLPVLKIVPRVTYAEGYSVRVGTDFYLDGQPLNQVTAIEIEGSYPGGMTKATLTFLCTVEYEPVEAAAPPSHLGYVGDPDRD